MEQEIRDMITTLTGHLTKPKNKSPTTPKSEATTSAHRNPSEVEEGGGGDVGLRIITLAGNNKGAVARATDTDEVKMEAHGVLHGDGEAVKFRAYANSNYQAVNNSVLLGGSYTAEDPGVEIEIVDHVEEDGGGDRLHEMEKVRKMEEEEEEEEEGLRL